MRHLSPCDVSRSHVLLSSKTNRSAVQYERRTTDIIRDPLTSELHFPALSNPSDLLLSGPRPVSDLLVEPGNPSSFIKTRALLTAAPDFTVAFTPLWCKHYTCIVVSTHGSFYSWMWNWSQIRVVMTENGCLQICLKGPISMKWFDECKIKDDGFLLSAQMITNLLVWNPFLLKVLIATLQRRVERNEELIRPFHCHDNRHVHGCLLKIKHEQWIVGIIDGFQ